MNDRIDIHTYALMMEQQPLEIYEKGILGNVQVHVLDPFDSKAGVAILHGYHGEPETYVQLWSKKEVAYFRVKNKKHIDMGFLVKLDKMPEKEEVVNENIMSNEEIIELVAKPFKSIEAKINKIDSEATLNRIVRIAEEENRPAKTMELLRSRLAEVQFGEEVEDDSGN